MLRKGRRIFAGIAWVVASLAAWAVVCNGFAFVVFVYLGNDRGVRLPSWSTAAYSWVTIAGAVLIPAFVAVLVMRAYLPGTGNRTSRSRGFAIETSRPPDAA